MTFTNLVEVVGNVPAQPFFLLRKSNRRSIRLRFLFRVLIPPGSSALSAILTVDTAPLLVFKRIFIHISPNHRKSDVDGTPRRKEDILFHTVIKEAQNERLAIFR